MVTVNPKYRYIKDVSQANIRRNRILLRVDFNVPIRDGKIRDERRINAALETINYIVSKNPKRLIIMSHRGRPINGYDPNLSLQPVADVLSKKINMRVPLITLEELEIHEKNYERGVFLLENTRFYDGEEENNPAFSKRLASLGDIYVNDAFATMHRKQSSTYGIISYLPSYIGFLTKKEIKYLDFSNPEHPFVVIIGGAKVSTKIDVINSFKDIADKIIIGSGMALTMYNAKGFFVGSSFVESTSLNKAKKVFDMKKIVLPVDFLVSKNGKDNIKAVNKKIDEFEEGDIGGDIGNESLKKFEGILKKAKTIFWNGPLGIYEVDEFSVGTEKLAKFIASLDGCFKVIGGGDISAAISSLNIDDKFDFISTGGGSALEFIAKGKLPVLDAIARSQKIKIESNKE